ncbi:MAG: hypothetical protein K1X28_10480 [Parachlamydiales bacterium]|nr:hypothetical protein [Parachlamydiales bacterium]
MSWFYSLVEHLFPRWMERKVERALSAYKYDLIMDGKYGLRMGLFSPKERWFIDQKLVGIFKNVIGRKTPQTLRIKAARWESKINKYYQKRELMIGSFILFQIGQKFPNFKNSINWMKALNFPYLEKHCKETFQNMNDDAIVQGITHFFSLPFDETKGLFRIFAEISYYVTKEKAKMATYSLYQSGVDKVASAGRSILNGFRYARNCLPI